MQRWEWIDFSQPIQTQTQPNNASMSKLYDSRDKTVLHHQFRCCIPLEYYKESII